MTQRKTRDSAPAKPGCRFSQIFAKTKSVTFSDFCKMLLKINSNRIVFAEFFADFFKEQSHENRKENMKRRKYLPFYREEDATNSAPRVFAAADTTPDVCKKSSGAAWNTSEGCLKEGCECADSSGSAPTSTICVSSSCTVDCDYCESPITEKDENCLATLGMLCFWRLTQNFSPKIA